MTLSRIPAVRIQGTSIFPPAVPTVLEGGMLLFSVLLFSGAALFAQQQPSMPGMQMQHKEEPVQPRAPEFPRLGRAQSSAKNALFTLDRALETARQSNPTLRQAEAGLRAARARTKQAALYPNPTLGYSGDEIRGGESHGGKQGFFVEQTIVTGGKLSRARDVFAKAAQLAEIEAEEQKIRVETAVQMAFYRVLAAQELADARADLARIANENLETERGLRNACQADETEILASELEARLTKLSARTVENTLREEWRALASVIGQPEMEPQLIAGALMHDW
jgi:cobalt-zinc-cadmium efflux system outer membrane protein